MPGVHCAVISSLAGWTWPRGLSSVALTHQIHEPRGGLVPDSDFARAIVANGIRDVAAVLKHQPGQLTHAGRRPSAYRPAASIASHFVCHP